MKKYIIYFAFLSVLLASFLSKRLPFINESWCVIIAFACFSSSFSATFSKGMLRIIGTIFGGICGLVYIASFNNNMIILSLFVLILGTISIYFNNKTVHGYAWIYFVVTFFAITKTYAINPNVVDPYKFVIIRTLSVTLGILIPTILLFFIESLISKTNKITLNKIDIFEGYFQKFDSNVFWYSLEAGISLALIALIPFEDNQNLIFGTTICLMFLSIIPFNDTGYLHRKILFKKIYLRIIGVIIGTGLGFVFLIIINQNNNLYYYILSLSIIIASYLQSFKSTSYLGIQIGIVLLILLIPAPNGITTLDNSFLRFKTVIISSLILFLSIIIVNFFKFLYTKLFSS